MRGGATLGVGAEETGVAGSVGAIGLVNASDRMRVHHRTCNWMMPMSNKNVGRRLLDEISNPTPSQEEKNMTKFNVNKGLLSQGERRESF